MEDYPQLGYRVVIRRLQTKRRGEPCQKRQMPDLIVCDYHLSEGNGIEAIERIRDAKREPDPGIP